MRTTKIALTVHPNGKSSADEYYKDGNTYIEGREGSNYTINVKNLTSERLLVIVSVDGLCVQTGKPAGLECPGYVLAAYQDINIPGWKINNQNASQFYFARKQDSYANKIGETVDNTGVIGAMVFEESRQYVPLRYHAAIPYPSPGVSVTETDFSKYGMIGGVGIPMNISAGSGSAFVPDASPVRNVQMSSVKGMSVESYASDSSTGFGEEVDFQTVDTTFERRTQSPAEILVLYYATATMLKRMGIQVRTRTAPAGSPNPFPTYSSSNTQTGCPIPPGWVRK